MSDDSGAPQSTGDDASELSGTDESDAGGDGVGDETGSDAGDAAAESTANSTAESSDTADSSPEPIGLAGAKDAAVAAAEELIDHPIDSVIRIERDGDGWRALIEVVERSAIPDTQDILGRYEIVVDDGGTLVQYGLEERYRRGENREEL
jgi:hypothetical protein